MKAYIGSNHCWWTGCSRCRTLLPVWWLVLDAPTIYHQCCVSYTGYQCASASTSRWPRSCTNRCLAFRHCTWPTTTVLSPMLMSGGCVPRRAEHASWRRHSAPLATAFSASGPVLWDSLPSHLKDADLSYNEFRRSLKTFLFGQWCHGAVWTLLTAPTRNIRTYLLT